MTAQRGSIRRRGDTWTAYWADVDPDGRRVQRSKGGFRLKKDASAHLTAVLGAKQRGDYVEPTAMTLGQFVNARWLPHLDQMVKSGQLRPSTASFYRRAATLSIVPALGGTRLVNLTAPDLNRLYAELLEDGRRDGRGGLSPTSVRAVAVTAGKMLDDALRWGLLAKNVAKLADPPAPAHPAQKVWTPEQLRTFLAHVADERLYAMWLLFVTSGMRRAEVSGLKWESVDLERAELRVVSTRTTTEYRVSEGPPKTAAGKRVVSLDPVTVAALKAHAGRQADECAAAGTAWTESGFVFVDELGHPLEPGSITKRFQQLAKQAGLPAIPLHGLRHSYATSALEAGVDLLTVSRSLGHSSLSITADVYASVTDRLRQQSANLTAAYILGEEVTT